MAGRLLAAMITHHRDCASEKRARTRVCRALSGYHCARFGLVSEGYVEAYGAPAATAQDQAVGVQPVRARRREQHAPESRHYCAWRPLAKLLARRGSLIGFSRLRRLGSLADGVKNIISQ